MTRLETGVLDIRRDWVDVTDVVRGAITRAKKSFPARRIELSVGARLPLIRGDAALLEQVLFNLLDIAPKYAPAGTTISISGGRDQEKVILQILDEGSGIPPEELGSVFEKFYRAQ
jgi:two-component system sensor histidine kinase KdpD